MTSGQFFLLLSFAPSGGSASTSGRFIISGAWVWVTWFSLDFTISFANGAPIISVLSSATNAPFTLTAGIDPATNKLYVGIQAPGTGGLQAPSIRWVANNNSAVYVYPLSSSSVTSTWTATTNEILLSISNGVQFPTVTGYLTINGGLSVINGDGVYISGPLSVDGPATIGNEITFSAASGSILNGQVSGNGGVVSNIYGSGILIGRSTDNTNTIIFTFDGANGNVTDINSLSGGVTVTCNRTNGGLTFTGTTRVYNYMILMI
jgi:hypothetical protein